MKRIVALYAAALAAVCSPAAAATLGEALNATYLTWTSGGSAAWYAQSTTTHDGLLAARSGSISSSRETWLETTVTGPGRLSFWWKVSSEAIYDNLEFYTNGVLQSRISGEVDWQAQNYTLGAGAHVLLWRYTKDGSDSAGQDRGWVDQVNMDPAITVQPVSQYREPGQSVTFSVTAIGTAPVGYQWWKDGLALAGGTGASMTLTNLQAGDAGNYRVVVTNQYGSVTSTVALLTVNLATVDSGFNPGAELGGPYYLSVGSLVVQADGKILVGGGFTTLAGQPRNYIGRLNADGTLDTGFNPGAGGDYPPVDSLAAQADGKILVGGSFTTLAGQPRNNIGRLNADGTLDNGFNPSATRGDGGSPTVYSLAVQADGKILVGGQFTTLGGQWRTNIGRLNADGTLDTGFNPGAGGNYPHVSLLAVQADGKILVGGSFTTLAGQPRNTFGRLNPDGTLDSGFDPGVNCDVDSLAVQADGKILVGGCFTTVGGQTRLGIGRLNPDGTLDSGFNPAAGATYPYNALVYSLAVQADGKILVGGYFTTLGGQTRNHIGRLNADGTLDGGFNPGASGQVSSLAVQADGKILVGGYFTTLGEQTRDHIGRLNNTEPATQSLGFDGSTITWLRGGTSPEAWRTTFDLSTDGLTWTNLGAGTRRSVGWELAVASSPLSGVIRGRGYITGGQYNGSGWFVESQLPFTNAPTIIEDPQSVTNLSGTTATFSVNATGMAPLAYQWSKDGLPLADGGHVSGAISASLTLANVQPVDAANYQVVVANAAGSVTSAVATLTVLVPPAITGQPQSRTNIAGTTAPFSVTATGTTPLSYRWLKNSVNLANGGNVSGATSASLTLANVQPVDAANYQVVVVNAAGSVTSAVARLTVLVPPAITGQLQSRTNIAGTTAAFSVAATGTEPLSYQWLKNSVNLADGGNVSGATSASLTLANVQPVDAANYQVVVANAAGSITSVVATLTVLVPAQFLTQPQNQTLPPGARATFSVTVTGAPPFSFQWCFNGTNLADGNRISGATTSTLAITNVQTQDAGSYTVVVANPWSSATSAPALLQVRSVEHLTLSLTNPAISRFDFTNVDYVETVLTNAGFPKPLVFYTLDGTDPSPVSTAYLGPFGITNTAIIRAVAYNPVDFSHVEMGPALVFLWTALRLTVSTTGGGWVEPAGGLFPSNTVVTLTAHPDSGWEFLRWTGDATGTSTNISVLMDRDKSVTAQFGRLPVFTLSVTTIGGGAVSGNTTDYVRGTVANLTAQPAPGCYFLSWGGDASGKSRDLSLLMDRDKSVVASFPPLTLLAVTTGGGAITANPATNFVQDSDAVLTAQTQSGWTFLNWMGDASGTNPSTTVTMDRPKEIQAVFGTECQTTVMGQGTVVRNLGTGLVPFGGVVRLAALPQPGSYFGLWGNAASSIINPLDFVVTNANPTVGAFFLPLGASQATLTVLEQGAGVASREPQANAYTIGQTVRLTAQPFPEQAFLGWSGDASGTQNPLTVTVTSNMTITATFTHRLALAIQQWPTSAQRRGFLCLLAGNEGDTCSVQTSPDLADWQPLTTLTISNTAVQFIDVAVTNHSPRFYRGVLR